MSNTSTTGSNVTSPGFIFHFCTTTATTVAPSAITVTVSTGATTPTTGCTYLITILAIIATGLGVMDYSIVIQSAAITVGGTGFGATNGFAIITITATLVILGSMWYYCYVISTVTSTTAIGITVAVVSI